MVAPKDFLHNGIVPRLQKTIESLGELIRDKTSDLDERELPGLDSLIEDWFNWDVNVTEEQFARRILQVFANSTHSQVYNDLLQKLPQDEQKAVNAFLSENKSAEEAGKIILSPATTGVGSTESAASIASAQFLSRPATQPQISSLESRVPSSKSTIEKEKKSDHEFQNWGRTVKYTPASTYYPETVRDIQTIVKEAVKNGRGVRVSGCRHSWSPVFGRNNKQGQKNNGDILISTLSEHFAADLPNGIALPGKFFHPKDTELNQINIVDASYVHGPALTAGKKYVRVGTGTTNEQFRRWCIKEGSVTLPMNVIMVEITMGGINAVICHGAGVRHATLSDLVRCIEYVDVNGEARALNMADPDLMKAASGCFGLIGVVTHVTLECDAMSTALFHPMKIDVIDAIPPPKELTKADIPAALWQPRTEQQRKKAQEDFERRANDHFYAEWFWFPYSEKVWVNTWDSDANLKKEKVVKYPSPARLLLQVVGTMVMAGAQNFIKVIGALEKRPYLQTTFLSWLAIKGLGDLKETDKPIRTWLPEALHFQRGIQNLRVRDTEVEIPLHAKKGTVDKRDYSNVQRAWWHAIIQCYADAEKCPMRMPLEMRIMGSSEVVMAPQRGNKLGTCAIEVLTLSTVEERQWNSFAQKIITKWTSYKDNDEKQLNIRPHWAKEWDQFKVDGMPWREKLKNDSYKNEIAEFKTLLAAIGKKHNWTLSDLKKTFSNETLDYLFLDDIDKPRTAAVEMH